MESTTQVLAQLEKDLQCEWLTIFYADGEKLRQWATGPSDFVKKIEVSGLSRPSIVIQEVVLDHGELTTTIPLYKVIAVVAERDQGRDLAEPVAAWVTGNGDLERFSR